MTHAFTQHKALVRLCETSNNTAGNNSLIPVKQEASQGSVKSASIIVCYQSEHKWHEILITKNVNMDFSKHSKL